MEKIRISDAVRAGLIAANRFEEIVAIPKFNYSIECIGADGVSKWKEDISNLVTNEGGNFVLDTMFKGSGYTAGWFLGLAGSGAKDPSDTLTSHPAWTEVNNAYSGPRLPITFGTTGLKSNTATAVQYAIITTATVAGAFVCNVASGTAGVLYSVSNFANVRNVINGDALNVTVTVSC